MASTNEDAVVLSASRFDDGRVLVVRHLPDRGTVEIGWWQDEDGAVVPAPPVLEIAAEAVEVEGLVRMCERAAAAEPGAAGEGEEIATAGPFADGARLAALRSGDGVALVRRPDRDDTVLLPRAALERLVAEMLPAATERIERLGFGLVQQGEVSASGPADGRA